METDPEIQENTVTQLQCLFHFKFLALITRTGLAFSAVGRRECAGLVHFFTLQAAGRQTAAYCCRLCCWLRGVLWRDPFFGSRDAGTLGNDDDSDSQLLSLWLLGVRSSTGMTYIFTLLAHACQIAACCCYLLICCALGLTSMDYFFTLLAVNRLLLAVTMLLSARLHGEHLHPTFRKPVAVAGH